MVIKKLVKISILKPKATILIIGLLTIIFCFFLPNLQREKDPWEIIPNNEAKQYFYTIKDYYNLNDLIVIGVESQKTIFNQVPLEKVERLTNQVKAITIVSEKHETELQEFIHNTSGEINSILKKIQKDGLSRDDILDLADLEDLIKNQRQPFSKLIAWIDDVRTCLFPFKKVNSFFTVEHIKGTEYGLNVEPFIKNLPEASASLSQIQEEALSTELFNKMYVSQNEKSTLLILELAYSESDMEKSVPLYYKLKDIVDSEQGLEKIYLGGTPILWVLQNEFIEKDLFTLVPIVSVVIMALLFLYFRNIPGVFLPMAVVLTSVIWTMGLMSILNVRLSVVGTLIPVVLIAIGTADAIHILTHYYSKLMNTENKISAIENTMDRMGKPVVITSLTSIAGFSSLAISKIWMIRDFGIFAAFGVFCAMIFSLSIIPASLILLRVPRRNEISKSTGDIQEGYSVFIKWGPLLQKAKWLSLAIIIILLCVAVYKTSGVKTDFSPTEEFKRKNELRQAHNFINKYFAGITWLNVILKSNEENVFKKPEILNKVNNLQEEIESYDEVGKVVSIVDYIKRMNYSIHGDVESYKRIPRSVEKEIDVDWIEKDGQEIEIEQEVEVKGYDQIAQYLLLYEGAGGKDIEKVIDNQYKQTNLNVFLTTDSSTTSKSIIRKISIYCNEMFPDDFGLSFSGISTLNVVVADLIIKGQIWSIVISLGVVLVMIICMIRSPIGILGILPIGFTILCNFAIMEVFHVSLDAGTSIVSSIVIGVGVDYCIHFMVWMSYEKEKGFTVGQATKNAIMVTGTPITLNAVVVACGFTVLVFSKFVPLINFGWLLSATMLICSISTLTIIPTILFLFSRRK